MRFSQARPHGRGTVAALQLAPNQLNTESLQHILLSLFENPRSAYAIGTACLKSLPANESSIQQLTNAIIAAAGCDIETMKTKQAVRQPDCKSGTR